MMDNGTGRDCVNCEVCQVLREILRYIHPMMKAINEATAAIQNACPVQPAHGIVEYAEKLLDECCSDK